MNIFHQLTVKTLKKNRVRTFVTIAGVILSTAMLSAVTTILSSISNFMLESVVEAEGSWQAAGGLLTGEQAEQFSKAPELETLAAVQLKGYAVIQEETYTKPYVCFMGFTDAAYQMLNPKLLAGHFPETADELAISRELLGYTGVNYNIGDRVTFSIGRRVEQGKELGQQDMKSDTEQLTGVEERSFVIVGIFERLGIDDNSTPGYSLITKAEEGQPYPVELYFTIHKPKEIFRFARENLSKTKVVFHDALLRYQGVADSQTFYKVIEGLGIIIILLIMGGSVALIYNAFSISVTERTKQFGLLSSVGATKRQMRKMIRQEAAMVSLIGIPLGLLSGVIGIGITLRFIGKGLEKIIGNEELSIHLSISWWSVAAAALLSAATVFFSAWIPALRSGKVSPMEAIRQTGEIKIPARRRQTSASAYRIVGFQRMLAVKNYRRSRRKYRSTVVSLVLSMVLFISSSSLVLYMKQGSSLVFETPETDIYFRSPSSETITYPILTENYRAILESGLVEQGALLERSFLELETDSGLISGEEEEQVSMPENGNKLLSCIVYIMEDSDFSKFLQEQGKNPEEFWKLPASGGILYDNAKKLDSKTGKYQRRKLLNSYHSLAILFPENPVAGEWGRLLQKTEEMVWNTDNGIMIPLMDTVDKLPMGAEIGNGDNSIIVLLPRTNAEQHQKLFPSPSKSELPDENADKSRSSDWVMAFRAEEHRKAYDGISRYFLEHNTMAIKEGFLFDAAEEAETDRNTLLAIQVLCYGFIILITLIAVTNVFHTISTNISLRRREFAMLRSVGLSQKDLKRVTGYECLFCVGRALLYGLPLAFAANLLIYDRISAGVKIKVLFPAGSVLGAVAGVTLILFCTMWYSVTKLNKENMIDALKNENI